MTLEDRISRPPHCWQPGADRVDNPATSGSALRKRHRRQNRSRHRHTGGSGVNRCAVLRYASAFGDTSRRRGKRLPIEFYRRSQVNLRTPTKFYCLKEAIKMQKVRKLLLTTYHAIRQQCILSKLDSDAHEVHNKVHCHCNRPRFRPSEVFRRRPTQHAAQHAPGRHPKTFTEAAI